MSSGTLSIIFRYAAFSSCRQKMSLPFMKHFALDVGLTLLFHCHAFPPLLWTTVNLNFRNTVFDSSQYHCRNSSWYSFYCYKNLAQPDAVVHAHNHSSPEAEAGGLWVQDQPGQHIRFQANLGYIARPYLN
jgi:hypothetical protein